MSNIWTMFCRHYLRKKDITHKDMIYPKEDLQAKIDCIAAYPEVRYVLITGGDALALSDNYLD